MKKRMKFIVLLVFLSFGLTTQAQLRFGIKGGLNLSTLSDYSDVLKVKSLQLDDDMDGKALMRSGLHLGVLAQLDLPLDFFVQPEVLFSLQGVKEKINGKSSTEALNYLQIPVYVGHKFNAGFGLDVIVGAGPYFAYGVSGTKNIFDVFKQYDVGAAAMAGIQISKLQVTLNYDFGLIDIYDNVWETAKEVLKNATISNRNLKVSIGYFF
ncbi:MAG: PorT family protein [Candidatus Symbiothrix sp.]|jgi:hypothetical protein|nr:PorT family protein [Candidatus Symbiothrix sp.]